jgi:copper chaperone CopZ
MIKKTFEVRGMECVGCTIAVEGSVEDLPGVKAVRANYARQIAEVEYDEAQVAEADIRMAVERAGYTFVGVK